MTLHDFRDILLTADPNASHYESSKKENYTVWAEYGAKGLMADNRLQEGVWRIQVDRFTKIEYDPMITAINSALDRDDITFEYQVDYEEDTGYIHHIWDCSVA